MDLPGLCADLIDLGASGTAVDQAPKITCYVEGDASRAEDFVKAVSHLPCDVVAVSQVQEENWTGACPDVWEPIVAGGFQVVPVESLSDERPTSPGAIRIIPGLGFGTGHHATTRMVLTALGSYQPPTLDDRTLRVFDLGTGSGILAIAAAKAFNIPVEGNDIDPGALDNARDNIALNQVSHLVTLSLDPLEKIEAGYDLILANVYGEVLMKLAAEVTRIARPGATAILSGITEIVWEQVWQVYGEAFGWNLRSELSESGWMCAVLQRPSV